MKKPAAPKTIEAATALLERYAVLAGEVALIEAVRTSELAAAGTKADKAAQPLLDEQATIAAQLEPWWAANAAALTKGDRKSMTIGGCKIGTKQGAASLALDGDLWDMAALLLKAARWAKSLWRAKPAVEKTAVLKALDGTHQDKLKAMGFSKKPGAVTFFVEAVAQAGTLTEAAKG